MDLSTVLLMAPQGQGGSTMSTFLMMGLMLVVFWFFMIRPQMRKQKELKNFREALKPGDEIVTTGGIHGKVTALQETTVTIKVEGGTTIKVEKSALVTDFNQAMQQRR